MLEAFSSTPEILADDQGQVAGRRYIPHFFVPGDELAASRDDPGALGLQGPHLRLERRYLGIQPDCLRR
jgi:hypothetical protein